MLETWNLEATQAGDAKIAKCPPRPLIGILYLRCSLRGSS